MNKKISLKQRIALLESESKETKVKHADQAEILETINALAGSTLNNIFCYDPTGTHSYNTPRFLFRQNPWERIFSTFDSAMVISVNLEDALNKMNFAELGELLSIEHKAFIDDPYADPCYVELIYILLSAAGNKE
jgi:hypothetical protein